MTLAIRRTTPDDLAALRAFLARLGPDSLRSRFWDDFLDFDDAAREAIAATGVVALDGSDVVGHAMLGRIGPQAAELAVEVADAWQRTGVGGRLVRAVVAAGREEGVATVVADVLQANQPMLGLLTGLGLPLEVAEHGRHLRVTVSL